MDCRLIGAKPISESMQGYCTLDPEEQTTVKIVSKYKTFHSWRSIWIHLLWDGGYFVLFCPQGGGGGGGGVWDQVTYPYHTFITSIILLPTYILSFFILIHVTYPRICKHECRRALIDILTHYKIYMKQLGGKSNSTHWDYSSIQVC